MENTAKIIQPINTSQQTTANTPTSVQSQPSHDWVFEVAESARKAEDSVQKFITDNPMRSVAIAVGLGFAANLIVKSIAARQEHV